MQHNDNVMALDQKGRTCQIFLDENASASCSGYKKPDVTEIPEFDDNFDDLLIDALEKSEVQLEEPLDLSISKKSNLIYPVELQPLDLSNKSQPRLGTSAIRQPLSEINGSQAPQTRTFLGLVPGTEHPFCRCIRYCGEEKRIFTIGEKTRILTVDGGYYFGCSICRVFFVKSLKLWLTGKNAIHNTF